MLSDDGLSFELGWLHLSDVHFGQGAARDEAMRLAVSNELIRDVVDLRPSIPRIDHIFVTGDIANSGDTRQAGEYAAAAEYLHRLCSRLDLSAEAVFTVPGNHDVDRSVARGDDDVRRWLEALRDRRESIDDSFVKSVDLARLSNRLANYFVFSQQFGAGFDATGQMGGLYWSTVLESESGFRLQLGGGNTALLCQDNADQGALQLGLSQLQALLNPDGDHDISVLLTHHPLDWLSDYGQIEPFLVRWADLHLFGHTHNSWTQQSQRGGQSPIVRVSAGALYDSHDSSAASGFTYSVSCIYSDATGGIWLRNWPRRWTPGSAGYRADVGAVPDGQFYVDHRLTESNANRRHRTGPLPDGPVERGSETETLLRAEAARSVRRLGSRRTAYPLDMSISELFDRDLFIPPRVRDYVDPNGLNEQIGIEGVIEHLTSGATSLILGEPGIGKSVASYAILRALPANAIPIYLRLREAREIIEAEPGQSELGRLIRRFQEESTDGTHNHC